MKRRASFDYLLGLLSILILWSNNAVADKPSAAALRRVLATAHPIETQSTSATLDPAKVELGRTLYFDPRLSHDSTTSCNSCHDLQAYGSLPPESDHAPKLGELKRDVPSIYHVGALQMFDWDGASASLNEKIKDALSSKQEMAINDIDSLVSELKSIDGYKALFNKAYGTDEPSISSTNIVDALSVFITGLTTEAPIDQFIAGDNEALSVEQMNGAQAFINHACNACHTGPNYGGQMLQQIGIAQPWPNQTDLGYYELTQNSRHKMFFRVSPLRNVAATAPYFHDRSSKNLRRAILNMARYERGHAIATEDIISIEAFLQSLTGKLPTEYIQQPTLP